MPAITSQTYPDPVRVSTDLDEAEMRQLLCGVDDVVLLEGCRVQVLAVEQDVVTFGVTLEESGGSQRIVSLKLATADSARPAAPAEARQTTSPRLFG